MATGLDTESDLFKDITLSFFCHQSDLNSNFFQPFTQLWKAKRLQKQLSVASRRGSTTKTVLRSFEFVMRSTSYDEKVVRKLKISTQIFNGQSPVQAIKSTAGSSSIWPTQTKQPIHYFNSLANHLCLSNILYECIIEIFLISKPYMESNLR